MYDRYFFFHEPIICPTTPSKKAYILSKISCNLPGITSNLLVPTLKSININNIKNQVVTTVIVTGNPYPPFAVSIAKGIL